MLSKFVILIVLIKSFCIAGAYSTVSPYIQQEATKINQLVVNGMSKLSGKTAELTNELNQTFTQKSFKKAILIQNIKELETDSAMTLKAINDKVSTMNSLNAVAIRQKAVGIDTKLNGIESLLGE